MTKRAPMSRMVDACMRCTKCGAKGVGTCSCWDAKVTLRCPKCGKTQKTAPEGREKDGDVIVLPCRDCAAS